MKKRHCKMVALVLFLVMLCHTTVCAKGDPAADILNTAPLVPTAAPAQYEPLNAAINALIAQITLPEMTAYDQAKACYDWLIVNMEYGMPDFSFTGTELKDFSLLEDYMAYAALLSHTGVCDHYSLLYADMLKAIGFNSYVVRGLTHMAGGGYTGHAWVVANINGTEYVFDPQVEDNIAKGGAIGYYRFCKTYAQVPDKYIIAQEAGEPFDSSGSLNDFFGPELESGEYGDWEIYIF